MIIKGEVAVKSTTFVLLGLVLFGCPGDSSNASGDDGAIRQLTIRVDPQPQIAVGVANGDPQQEFDQVSTPFLLPNGSLAVPSAGHGQIRVFDANGRLVRTYGGPGQGPGEFVRLGGAWARGDTIEALDLALRRITRFLPTGDVEVIRLNGPPVIWAVGPASDGWILANIVAPGQPPGSLRDQMAAYWFNSSGDFVSNVARIEGIRRVSIPGSMAAEAFSPSVRFGVWNDEIYVGETLRPMIRVMNRFGATDRTVQWESKTVAPSAALDQVQAALRAAPALRTPRVQEILDAPLPNSIPAYTDFLIDQNGLLWVRPYVPARDATVLGGTVALHRQNRGGDWIVLGRTGNRVATVSLPDDLEPYQITSSALVGIARDELGVESVRVHHVSRR